MPAFGVLCWTFAGFGRSPRSLPLAGSVTKAVDRVDLLCVVRPRYISLMSPSTTGSVAGGHWSGSPKHRSMGSRADKAGDATRRKAEATNDTLPLAL